MKNKIFVGLTAIIVFATFGPSFSFVNDHVSVSASTSITESTIPVGRWEYKTLKSKNTDRAFLSALDESGTFDGAYCEIQPENIMVLHVADQEASIPFLEGTNPMPMYPDNTDFKNYQAGDFNIWVLGNQLYMEMDISDDENFENVYLVFENAEIDTSINELLDQSKWHVLSETDEFGDEIEGSNPVMGMICHGTFSNTATTNSELTVYVYFNSDVFDFKLFEYNDIPATSLSFDKIVFKTKINDEVHEYDVQESKGGIFLAPWHSLDDYNYLFTALQKDIEIKCYIKIGASEYNFTMDNTGFYDLYTETFID